MLDTSDKKLVKELFADWLEIQDQRKQLNQVNKETLEKVASVLDVNKTTANKLFGFMKKRVEDGNDELDVITNLAMSIED